MNEYCVAIVADVYTSEGQDIHEMIRDAIAKFYDRYRIYPTDVAVSIHWRNVSPYYFTNALDSEAWQHYLELVSQKQPNEMISSRHVLFRRWKIAIHQRKDVQINEVRSVRLGELP